MHDDQRKRHASHGRGMIWPTADSDEPTIHWLPLIKAGLSHLLQRTGESKRLVVRRLSVLSRLRPPNQLDAR